MKHSFPVLVASSNEDIRLFLRDMLGKHGFFHVLEAATEEEARHFFETHDAEAFSILHHSLLSPELVKLLKHARRFIILSQPDDERTINWSVQLGAKHFLSFPYSARMLGEKINEII